VKSFIPANVWIIRKNLYTKRSYQLCYEEVDQIFLDEPEFGLNSWKGISEAEVLKIVQ
jgi:hypothetical protein